MLAGYFENAFNTGEILSVIGMKMAIFGELGMVAYSISCNLKSRVISCK